MMKRLEKENIIMEPIATYENTDLLKDVHSLTTIQYLAELNGINSILSSLENVTRFSLQQFKNCYSTFIECKMVGANINYSLLKNIEFNNCKMDFIIISESKITNVTFNKCSIIEGSFYQNNLSKKSYYFIDNDMRKINIYDSLKGISLVKNNINGINIDLNNIKGSIISREQSVILCGLLGVDIDE